MVFVSISTAGGNRKRWSSTKWLAAALALGHVWAGLPSIEAQSPPSQPQSGQQATQAQLFQSYEWPGNIRELENMIKRIVILQDEQLVIREVARSPRTAAAFAMADPWAQGLPGPTPLLTEPTGARPPQPPATPRPNPNTTVSHPHTLVFRIVRLPVR